MMILHYTGVLCFQIEFLPSDTNFGAYLIKNLLFPTGDFPQRIFIVFGLQPQDMSHCHYSDSECFGRTVYDDQFSMGETEQQAFLVSFCVFLVNMRNTRRGMRYFYVQTKLKTCSIL